MSDTSHDAWEAAKAHDDAHNLPVSLLNAVLEHHNSPFTGTRIEDIAVIAPLDHGYVNDDEAMTVSRVDEHGAVLHDERGGVSMGVAHVQAVVDHVVEETEYVVTELSDTEHLERPSKRGDGQ